jgi:hypothetical protein
LLQTLDAPNGSWKGHKHRLHQTVLVVRPLSEDPMPLTSFRFNVVQRQDCQSANKVMKLWLTPMRLAETPIRAGLPDSGSCVRHASVQRRAGANPCSAHWRQHQGVAALASRTIVVDERRGATYICDMINPAAYEAPSRFETMTFDWDFTAQSFMDQLPATDQNRVLVAVERLLGSWPKIDVASVHRLRSSADGEEYLLRVSGDLRVVFRPVDQTIRIVDVFRRSQLEGQRALQPHG